MKIISLYCSCLYGSILNPTNSISPLNDLSLHPNDSNFPLNDYSPFHVVPLMTHLDDKPILWTMIDYSEAMFFICRC